MLDDINTICEPVFIYGNMVSVKITDPAVLVAKVAMMESYAGSTDITSGAMPALLIRRSVLPANRLIWLAASLIMSRFVISSCTTFKLGCSSASILPDLEVPITWYFSASNFFTSARPMPLLAPVTTAVLFAAIISSNDIVNDYLYRLWIQRSGRSRARLWWGFKY